MAEPLSPARNLDPEEFPNADLQPVAGPDRRSAGERCVDYAIRISIVMHIFIILACVVLIVLGSTGHIAFSWIYGGISGVVVFCILFLVLLKWEVKRRKDGILKRWNIAQERSRKWGYEQWEIVMASRRGNRLLHPQDNPEPVVDELIVEERIVETPTTAEQRIESPSAVERTDDSQSDDTSVESYPRTRPETVTKVLTRHLLRAKSAPILERGRHEFCTPTESTATRLLQRSLNDLRSRFARPVPLLPFRRSRLITADVEKSDPQTLEMQQLPTQIQSWRMARSVAQIPGATSELGLRQPVQRSGIQAWHWDETSVTELPREDLQSSSASVLEGARHGQSMPTELTMITPLQQAMEELATPRILSELAQPVGTPLFQRSRRVTGGGGGERPDLKTLHVQQLRNQEQIPQIPGAVYELEDSEDPIQGPDQGPCPLAKTTLRERRPSQELENSGFLSELAQPVGIPLVQRSRRVSGGGERPDLETLHVQQLLNQEQIPQIPGAVYELEGSEDPVQGPVQGPCPLADLDDM